MYDAKESKVASEIIYRYNIRFAFGKNIKDCWKETLNEYEAKRLGNLFYKAKDCHYSVSCLYDDIKERGYRSDFETEVKRLEGLLNRYSLLLGMIDNKDYEFFGHVFSESVFSLNNR